MDAATREFIMKQALGVGSESSGPITEEKVADTAKAGSVTESVENKLYEFRDKLKQVHAYERKVKIDSEDWDEDTWEAFESSLKAPVNSFNSKDLFEDVLKNKVKNVLTEAEQSSKVRALAIDKIDFSLFSKLI